VVSFGDDTRTLAPMPRRTLVMLLLAPLVLAGCFTGERPSFSADPFAAGQATGDPAIDAVLASFDGVSNGPLTASYTVLRKFGNTTHSAVVALEPGRRSITVGTVRYLFDTTGESTCDISDGSCTQGFQPASISDTGITADFYASDTARRLRRDAQAKIGPTVSRDEMVAGQSASCVDVPVSGGTAVYCVLPDGVLALLDDGDVRVTLTDFRTSADAAVFSPSQGGG
jgi:hypothetical protein